jgi:iron(III) transport system ATP-binding protein
MHDGKIIQVGRPREIYEQPNCKFVAQFIGTSNFIDGVVKGHEESRRHRGGGLDPSRGRHGGPRATGPSGPNEWSGEVLTRAFLGDSVDHIVGVGKYEIRNRANPDVSIAPGTKVCLRMEPAKLTLVPLEG